MGRPAKQILREPGVGFDFGTSFLASAYIKEGQTHTNSLRDCYLILDKSDISKNLISDLSDVLYIEEEDRLIILADKAWKLSGSLGSVFEKGSNKGVLKTPLYKGFINPSEQDAFDILKAMVKSMIGEPVTPDELAYFSVPSAPLDDEEQDEVYHKSLLEDILVSLGYRAEACNEAHAITFSECQDDDFSGLCISWGHGMTNFCLTLDTVEALRFSVAKGGSFIDAGAAKSLHANPILMQSIKESPDFDLMKPVKREEKAIQAYYKELIRYAIGKFKMRFKAEASNIFLDKPVPIVVSGGTSLPKGFIELFKQCLGDINSFPIPIKEIRHASDPLKAVAKGLLIKARSEMS